MPALSILIIKECGTGITGLGVKSKEERVRAHDRGVLAVSSTVTGESKVRSKQLMTGESMMWAGVVVGPVSVVVGTDHVGHSRACALGSICYGSFLPTLVTTLRYDRKRV